MNAFSRDDRTPLHFAVQHKSFQIVKVNLLFLSNLMMKMAEASCRPRRRCRCFRATQLDTTARSCKIRICADREGQNRTFASISLKDHGIQILIEAGANVNTANDASYTPLYTAAEKGYTELVKVGITPLIRSLLKDDGRQTLVDAGADVDVFNQYNYTPLHIAVNRGFLQITKVGFASSHFCSLRKRQDADPYKSRRKRQHCRFKRLDSIAWGIKSWPSEHC